jgi:hypothetical protein
VGSNNAANAASGKAAFVAKAASYTTRYATAAYIAASPRWHDFYGRPPYADYMVQRGKPLSAIEEKPTAEERNDVPAADLERGGSTSSDAAEEAEVDHPSAPAPGAECAVFFVDLEPENYVEYRTAPSGRWFAAPVRLHAAPPRPELPQNIWTTILSRVRMAHWGVVGS